MKVKIKSFAIIEIERSKGASIVKLNGITESIAKKLLIEALPQGEPQDFFVKALSIENQLYLSVLALHKEEDYGLAMVIHIDDELENTNPFGFVEDMYEKLQEYISTKQSYPDELDIEYHSTYQQYPQIEDLDYFLFALFTKQNVIVIGNKSELIAFIKFIYQVLPPISRSFSSVIINSNDIEHNVHVQGILPSKDIIELITQDPTQNTVVFLSQRKVYGRFSSPFCKKIAKLLFQGKFSEIQTEITKIFKLATESDEILPVADFAHYYRLNPADASLVLWIRANYYHLATPEDLQKIIY